MTQNLKIFDPVLSRFCEKLSDLRMNDEFSCVFLPHVMKGYETSKDRTFYFGRDTNGWISTKTLLNNYKNKSFEDYYEETSEWINNYGFLEYNNNKAHSFWTLAMRLHLRLKGITDEVKVNIDLDDEFKSLINDFGYGNTNSIEVKDSLIKQGVWDNLDHAAYWEIKKESKVFDRLSFTIDAYKPKRVFIFNWQCDENEFLQGYNYKIEKLKFIDGKCWKINIPETGTQIIWSVHPTGARYLGYNSDSMIEELIEAINGN